MSYNSEYTGNGSGRKPYAQNSNRIDEESVDAIRRVIPEHSSKILDGPAENCHVADLHRWAKTCKAAASGILDKAAAEKRQLTDLESEAFDSVIRIVDFFTNEHNLNKSAPQLHDGNTPQASKTPGIYARGERCGSGFPAQNGVDLGSILSAMVMGSGSLEIRNALSEGTDSSGGYSVPVELMRDFVDLLRDKSVLNTAGAKTVLLESQKTNLATLINDPTAGWRAENAPVSESDLTLGNVQFVPKSLAVLVKVSRELAQDSVNIQEILINALALGLAAQLDFAGLFGTGANNQPTGLKSVLTTASRVSNLGTNGQKLSASGVKWTPILAAQQKIAASNDQATAAIMHSRTLFDLQGLTDTTGQPLRPPAVVESLPLLDSNSVPVNLTQGSATTASEIFTGNFSNLYLGLRQELRIEILKEAFSGNLQIGFLCHLRADWQCVKPSSFWLTQGILAE